MILNVCFLFSFFHSCEFWAVTHVSQTLCQTICCWFLSTETQHETEPTVKLTGLDEGHCSFFYSQSWVRNMSQSSGCKTITNWPTSLTTQVPNPAVTNSALQLFYHRNHQWNSADQVARWGFIKCFSVCCWLVYVCLYEFIKFHFCLS